MKKLTPVFLMLLMSGSLAASPDYPIGPKFSQGSYQLTGEYPAQYCEFSTIDFAEINSGYRGSGAQYLQIRFALNSERMIINAGAVIDYTESGTRTVYDPITESMVTTIVPSERFEDLIGAETFDQYQVTIKFQTKLNSYQDPQLERQIHTFAYFIDVESGPKEAVRLWFVDSDGRHLFEEADYSKDRYNYSDGIFLGGYSSAYYLWRDDGSPLFSKTENCI